MISCESPLFSSSKFIISDPCRTLARCLQVKWQMFPNRRQEQSKMIDVVLSFLQVYFQAFLSNHSLFCFRLLFLFSSLLIFSDLFSEKVSIKKWSKMKTKNSDYLISRTFLFFSLLHIRALVVTNLMANSRLHARKTKQAFIVSWGPSRGRWSMIIRIHDWVCTNSRSYHSTDV